MSNIPKTARLILLGLISLVIVGCVPVSRPEQQVYSDNVILSSNESIGQTFTSRYRGLNGIDIYINPEGSDVTTVALYLLESPDDTQPIVESVLTLDGNNKSAYYSFPFQSQPDSNNKDYYAKLVVLEDNKDIKIGSGPGDAYLDGALYKNDQPRNEQLTFRLSYDLTQMIIGLGQLAIIWLLYLIIGIFLYILPGWAILSLLLPGWKNKGWAEKAGLSSGISLAIYPLLILWSNLFGLQIGSLITWAVPALGLLILLYKNWGIIKHPRSIDLPPPRLPDIALIFILFFVIAVRFWVIHNLEAPMWGDSVHHTMISQLLVDNGGLFEVWAPYAELQTFTYHFGFHSIVAVFHWGTNLPLSLATLWIGQIVNALAVLTLYPLAIRLGKNPWTGILTILLAGLLVPMPMFFVNWGRYTQLTGLAILPVSTYLLWNGYDDHDANKWRYALLIWLALGGLALTHYRVLVFGLIFILAYPIIYANRIQIKSFLIKSIIFCTGAGVLFLPWFINVFSGKILQMFGLQISTAASQISTSTLQYNSIGELTTYLPALLWIAFILSLGWGLWRRSRAIALLGAWWFLILLLANPLLFNLPGTGAINNFMVFISAYIPVCLIVSTAIIWIATNIQAYFKEVTEITVSIQTKKFIILSLMLFLIIVTLIGAYSRLQDVHPTEYAMLTRPDKRAFNWLSEILPSDSNFLVNSFSAYGGAAIVGSDGGWWLPLLTEFKSTQPPINYTMEVGPFPDYQLWVNELNSEIQAKGINHPDVVSMLNDRKVTHIYIGQQQGQVGYSGPALNPDVLIASPYYSMVYHKDRVWVFQFDF